MRRFLALAGALALACLAAPALAQSQNGTAVVLNPILELLLQFLAAILGILLIWLVRRIAGWLGVKIDKDKGAVLDAALQKAVAYGLGKVSSGIAGGTISVTVRNAALAHALDYALKAVPDTLDHFGITPERLQQMLAARLAIATGDVPVVASPSGPVTAAPAEGTHK